MATKKNCVGTIAAQFACKYPYVGPSSFTQILSVTKCIVLLLWRRRSDQRSLELHAKIRMWDHIILPIKCRLQNMLLFCERATVARARRHRVSTLLALLEKTRIFLSFASHHVFFQSFMCIVSILFTFININCNNYDVFRNFYLPARSWSVRALQGVLIAI